MALLLALFADPLPTTASCLTKLNILNEQFKNLNYIYPSKTVLVAENKNNKDQWIIVTEYDGILIYNHKVFTVEQKVAINGETIQNATYDEVNGTLWLASDKKIMKIVDWKIVFSMPKKGFTNDMLAIHGDLFYINDEQLHKIDKYHKHTTNIIPTSKLLSLGIPGDNNLVAAGNGAYLVDLRDLSYKLIDKTKPHTNILRMTNDYQGNVYYSCNRNLYKYDINTDRIDSFDTNHGLPNESIGFVKYDGDKNIWIGSRSSGLCGFDISTHLCTCYKEEEGLASNVHLFGLSRVKDGIIAGSQWQYFSYFQPKKLDNIINKSKISFQNIRINNEDKTPEVNQSGSIEVSSSKSLISLDIAFPIHVSPSYYHFQYRLRSKNDTLWSDISTDHKIILNQIAPIEYNLELKATNRYYSDDNTSTSLYITSLSPFYLKWWFFVLITLVANLLVYLIYKYRQLQRRKIENLRANISKDLHDEMGSNLSNIMLLGEVALLKDEKDTKHLKQIVDKTKDVMRSMSDIVWSINPGNDVLPNIIRKIQDTAIDLLEPLNIRLTFDIGDDLQHIELDMYKRQGFYMIIKEAINNCAKYSDAKNVNLKIQTKNNYIQVSLRDDGKGFDINTVKKGNGLHNMVERAQTIGGQAFILSESGSGTTVNLILPIN